MTTRPQRALLLVTAFGALLSLGAILASAPGCELLVQLDPAQVDAGEPDALPVEEETPEAAPPTEAGTDGPADAGDAADAADATDAADAGDAGDAAEAGETSETSTPDAGAG